MYILNMPDMTPKFIPSPSFFFTFIPCILILPKFYLPPDVQLNCLKNNFKIYIKIDIKIAPTCFGVIIIIRERTIRSC